MSRYKPRNPDYVADITRAFADQGAMRAIGAELALIEPGRCVLRVPYSDSVTQQHGFFHGGVIGMLADVAGGIAAASLCEAGWGVLTVEYKINFIAPATGTAILATGHVVRAGRSLLITRMDVAAVQPDGTHKECAIAQQTIMAMAPGRV